MGAIMTHAPTGRRSRLARDAQEGARLAADDKPMDFLGGGASLRAAREQRPEAPKLVFYTFIPDLGGQRAAEVLTREQITERLRDGRAGPNDLARLDGEPGPRRLDERPEFLGFFQPGTPEHAARLAVLEGEEERRRARAAADAPPPPPRRARLALLAIGLIGALALAALVALRAPEDAPAARGPLPGAAWVQGLGDPGPPPEGFDPELAWLGVAGPEGLSWSASRAGLEALLVARPREARVAGALAVAYARLATEEPALRAASVAMMERALALEPDGLVAARMDAGLALFGGGEIEAAARAARACLAAFPEDAVCGWMLGQALMARGELDGGLAALEAASQNLGGAAMDHALVGLAALEGLDLLAAERALARAVEARPEAPGPWLLQARLLAGIGRHAEALAAAEAALAHDPARVEAALLAGALELHALGRPAAAADRLTPFAQAPPEAPGLRHELLLQAAFANRAAGRAEPALGFAEAALALRPGDPPAVLARAQALVALGQPEAAARQLREAALVQLDEADAARYLRASAALLDGMGAHAAAAAAREQALTRTPESVDLVFEESAAQLRRGAGELAIVSLLGLWRLDPLAEQGHDPVTRLPLPPPDLAGLIAALEGFGKRGSPERMRGERAALAVRATRCAREGRGCTEARAALREALRVDPDDRVAHTWMVHVLLRQGDPDAERHLTLASGGVLSDPLVAALRGQIMAARGAVGTAEEVLRDAARLGQAQPHLLRRVAEALLRLGRAPEAAALARRVAAASPRDQRARALLLEAQRAAE